MVYLGTRLGTGHGTALGSGGARVERLIYALTGFSAANFYATPANGGEAGAGTGFVVAILVRLSISAPPGNG